jgi:transposase InsO family protein
MGNRETLGQAEKERIYHGKLKGQTIPELAHALDCSRECVRKWWRVGRDHGLEGLRASRTGRGPSGRLSRFDPRVAQRTLELKRANRGWGAQRLLIELIIDADLQGLPLPCASSLAAFFKAHCPECISSRTPREHSSPPLQATEAHQVWQLDSQERVLLTNGEIATICNIRDPYGAAIIASQAFEVRTERAHRKLKWTEVRQVLRQAFTEWQTLPDCIQTDNELGLAGAPREPYPGRLTLWLVGLGIQHRFIRPGRPTDQPQIERNHRTIDGLALNEAALLDMAHLQTALDRERQVYNFEFPSHASDCQGQPPLTAHPELRHSRRTYHPDHELAIFDLQRVLDYLATFTFERKLNSANQVRIGREVYYFSAALIPDGSSKEILVRLDPVFNQWVFSVKIHDVESEFARRPTKTLNVHVLTDLEPQKAQAVQPFQLSLAFSQV